MNINVLEGTEELLSGILIPLVLSAGATVARVAEHGWQGLGRFFAELAMSVFVGVSVHWGLTAFDLTPAISAAIVAASSYFCGVILDACRQRLVSEILNRGSGPGGVNVAK